MTRESAPYFAGANGDGIVTFSLDCKAGTLDRRSTYTDIHSPSYLALGSDRQLYAVESTFDSPGRLCAFGIDDAGHLTLIDARATHGHAACHVDVMPGGKAVYTASYLGTCVDAFPIGPNNLISEPRTLWYQGRGLNAARQESAHAHQAMVDPSKTFLCVCDLGSDCVWIHDLVDAMPAPHPRRVEFPAGSGPRHLSFHPTLPMAYVLCELSGAVFACSWGSDRGELRRMSEHSGLPGTWPGTPAASAIRAHPSGRTLYAGHRNHHSIAIFRLDTRGIPAVAEQIPSGGCEPRDFTFDPSGRWMIVANLDSHNLAILEIDPETALPNGRAARSVPIHSPAAVICAG